MSTIKLRKWAFVLHRYIGLVVGLVLIIIGLTGSVLVFQREIDAFVIAQRFGQVVVPESQTEKIIPLELILDRINDKFKDQPETSVRAIAIPNESHNPYVATVQSKDKKLAQVYVNPYLGEIMGVRDRDSSWIGLTLELHRKLLAGKTGEAIAGIVALFLFILCLTGLALWKGWQNLGKGFTIARKANTIQLNLDIHQVIGIIAVLFLAANSFTGFCWSFSEQTKPMIYAATFTPEPPKAVSKPISGKPPLSITELLAKADSMFPNAATTFISFPQKPNDAMRIGKKQIQESDERGSTRIWLDQYSGKVLQVQDGLKLSRAEAVSNSFFPLHYGTFGGLPTRILYVFVGCSPLILFITGAQMFKMRRWDKAKRKEVRELVLAERIPDEIDPQTEDIESKLNTK
jgi:uncharacterized iron-regulated membrane protein